MNARMRKSTTEILQNAHIIFWKTELMWEVAAHRDGAIQMFYFSLYPVSETPQK